MDTQFSRLRIEVCAESGGDVLHVCDLSSALMGLQNVLTFAFHLDRAYEDVEFRFETYGDFEGEIRKLTLRPHPASAEGFTGRVKPSSDDAGGGWRDEQEPAARPSEEAGGVKPSDIRLKL